MAAVIHEAGAAPAVRDDVAGARPLRERFRVLHLINGEHYSGAERVQDLLARRLPELGFDVGLACLKPEKFPEMRQWRGGPRYSTPEKAPRQPRGPRRPWTHHSG